MLNDLQFVLLLHFVAVNFVRDAIGVDYVKLFCNLEAVAKIWIATN